MRIWVPRCKIIEPKAPTILRCGLAGRYKLRAIAPHHGTVRRESPWFSNLILDNGLDIIGGVGVVSGATHKIVAVGTGTATPAVGQTALSSLLASTSSIQSATQQTNSVSPYEMTKTWVFRFGQGDAEGNLTEVGIGVSTSALFSRELIRDASGDPTSFPVASDEFLDVTYQLQVFPPLTDVEDSVSISGVTHDVVMRASNVGSDSAVAGWRLSASQSSSFQAAFSSSLTSKDAWNGAIGAITGAPSGSSSDATSRSNSSYTAGTFRRDVSLTWGLDNGNLTDGISATRIQFGDTTISESACFQCSYDPAIDKDATKILTLNYRISWARADVS